MDSYRTTHEAELERADITRKLLRETKTGVSKRNRLTLRSLYGAKSNKAKILAAAKSSKPRSRDKEGR